MITTPLRVRILSEARSSQMLTRRLAQIHKCSQVTLQWYRLKTRSFHLRDSHHLRNRHLRLPQPWAPLLLYPLLLPLLQPRAQLLLSPRFNLRLKSRVSPQSPHPLLLYLLLGVIHRQQLLCRRLRMLKALHRLRSRHHQLPFLHRHLP